MKLHFAAEIVLELACKLAKGIEKIGAHIGEYKSRIDFFCPDGLSHIIDEFARQAKEIIAHDREIESAFSNEEQERRYWKTETLGPVDCGGTHLKRTGEIGNIELRLKRLGRDKERVEFRLLPEVGGPAFGST